MDSVVGIPIGNLLSQVYALIYLNPLDHFIKRDLRVKRYVRYVDDFILIGLSRDECIRKRAEIVRYLKSELGLELSKSTIQKVSKGVNFVGYRTWRTCRVIRKHSLHKFKRKVKSGSWPAVVSLLGHAKNTNSISYMMRIIKEEHMILSYRKITDQYTTHIIEDQLHDDVIELCTIDGVTYVSVPDDSTLPEFKIITVKKAVLSNDIKAAIRDKSPHFRLLALRMGAPKNLRLTADDEARIKRMQKDVGEAEKAGAVDAFLTDRRSWDKAFAPSKL